MARLSLLQLIILLLDIILFSALTYYMGLNLGPIKYN